MNIPEQPTTPPMPESERGARLERVFTALIDKHDHNAGEALRLLETAGYYLCSVNDNDPACKTVIVMRRKKDVYKELFDELTK